MNIVLRRAGLAASCLSLGACATITRGTTTDWAVSSSPPGASVRTTTGLTCDSTPCSIRVPRKAEFTATVEKPGYKPQTVQVYSDISTAGGIAFAGNIILGGLFGLVVDYVTGAPFDPTPNHLTLALQGDGSNLGGDDYSQPSRVDQTSYSPPANMPSYRIIAKPANAGADLTAGRVVYLRVLPDGSAQEIREAP